LRMPTARVDWQSFKNQSMFSDATFSEDWES
jgi:hypothetical protein